MIEMGLYDIQGDRLYLSADECSAFLAAAWKRPPDERTFAGTLTFTGCRISEALEISPGAWNWGAAVSSPEASRSAAQGGGD